MIPDHQTKERKEGKEEANKIFMLSLQQKISIKYTSQIVVNQTHKSFSCNILKTICLKR